MTEYLIISLEERHANNILAGTKQVELRRRAMHVNIGDRVWLYVKKPVGAIVGYATIDGTVCTSPATFWKKYGSVTGLSRTEFFGYFDGADSTFALKLSLPTSLKRSVSLETLKNTQIGFHPPQFYCKVLVGTALRRLLARKIIACE